MTDSTDVRRRRAQWRASHRGTKELDLLIGKFAEAHIAEMDEPALQHFEAFLSLADPELQRWLLASALEQNLEFGDVISAIRRFHGLDTRSTAV